MNMIWEERSWHLGYTPWREIAKISWVPANLFLWLMNQSILINCSYCFGGTCSVASTVLSSCCILRAPLRSRNHQPTPTPQEMIMNRPGVDSRSLLSQAFPRGSESKESAYNARDPGLTPGSERSPGKGNGYTPLYSCVENPIDRGTR